MKVLITGIAGHLGSRLALRLLASGHSVWGIDDLSTGFEANVPRGCKYTRYCTIDGYTLSHAFKRAGRFDVVVHLAAFASEAYSPFCRAHTFANITATAHVVNACIMHKTRLVFASSAAVYGQRSTLEPATERSECRPMDPYGISKLASELDLRAAREQHGLDYRVARLHNCYGPGQSLWQATRNVFGIWARQRLQADPLTLFGDGDQLRQFTYADDACVQLEELMQHDALAGVTLNIGDDNASSIEYAAMLFGYVTDYAVIARHAPRHESQAVICSHAEAQRVLSPVLWTPLYDGLAAYWDWARYTARQFPRRRATQPRAELTTGLYAAWQT